MDGRTVGLVGGVVGSVLGTCGGLLGSYFSLKNAKGPRERALMWRLTILAWLNIGAMISWMVVMPSPWRQAAFLLNLPFLLSISRWNRQLAAARAEDDGASASLSRTAPPLFRGKAR